MWGVVKNYKTNKWGGGDYLVLKSTLYINSRFTIVLPMQTKSVPWGHPGFLLEKMGTPRMSFIVIIIIIIYIYTG